MKKYIALAALMVGCLVCSAQNKPVSVDDIVKMKQAGISDEVIAAYIQSQPKITTNFQAAAPTVVQPQVNMDSYAYYQQYYLQPRALGYSYQLMYPAPVYYRPPAISFSFGFGGGRSYYSGHHHSGYYGGHCR